MKTRNPELSFVEFVLIVSLMMSLTALSIDAMMAALPTIGHELGIQNVNERQLIISVIFLGMAVGQLFFGPLSDSTGRKPAVYAGYGVYMIGSFVAIFATSFPTMLAGRLLQGIGVSAPRAITMALVRDRYAGRMMARVMSFVMTVFILVPMLAPSLGQFILLFVGWRGIFVGFVIIALINLIWFALRMPETLSLENRTPFSLHHTIKATSFILKNRAALGYTVSAGLVGGFFLGYLNSAQQIFQEQYALGEFFPILFGVISMLIQMPLGTIIGQSYNNTIFPLVFGIAILTG